MLPGLVCGVSQLVNEGLNHKALRVGSRCAECSGFDHQGHDAGADGEIRYKAGREFAARDLCGGREIVVFAKADEVVLPSGKFTVGIDSAFQIMKTAGAVVVVLHVVFAGPDEFDWLADRLAMAQTSTM